jgi:hypothetical protein
MKHELITPSSTPFLVTGLITRHIEILGRIAPVMALKSQFLINKIFELSSNSSVALASQDLQLVVILG